MDREECGDKREKKGNRKKRKEYKRVEGERD